MVEVSHANQLPSLGPADAEHEVRQPIQPLPGNVARPVFKPRLLAGADQQLDKKNQNGQRSKQASHHFPARDKGQNDLKANALRRQLHTHSNDKIGIKLVI